MILASVDVESTGLSVTEDRVIEFGGILYSTNQRKCLDSQGILVKADVSVTSEITKITGITQAAIDRFGYDPEPILDVIIDMIENSDAVIGYNVRRFDKKILDNWAHRAGRELPERTWIDLYMDLPWQVPVGKLSHAAADHGILNLFPHSALADAQTVLAIAEKYDPELLLSRAQSPVVILRSLEPRSNNEAVKKARFRWNPNKTVWWRSVKEADVDEIMSQIQIKVVVDKELTQEEME